MIDSDRTLLAKDLKARDHFALAALPIAIEHWRLNFSAPESERTSSFDWNPDANTSDCAAAARMAYRMADAMMEARNSNSDDPW